MTTVTNLFPEQTIEEIHPSFLKMVRGELFKLTHNRGITITIFLVSILFLLIETVGILLDATNINSIGSKGALYLLLIDPTRGLGGITDNARQFSGILVIIVTVISICLEYQQGTIRVLLAHGIDRVALLFAKGAAVTIFSLFWIIAASLVALLEMVIIFGIAGHLDVLGHNIPSYFGRDLAIMVFILVMNTIVTALFAMTLSVLGRSLAVGLGVTLSYFFAESIVSGILLGISAATKNAFWGNIQAYLFGNNLDMASRLINHGSSSAEDLSGMHSLIVTAIYALIFVVVSVGITRYRDVQN
jgi:ABC-2 type transport system permease protein